MVIMEGNMSKGAQNVKTQKDNGQSVKKIYKALRILGNVIFVPFLLIILLSTILMMNAKTNNEVPSLFGYSALRIESPSMMPEYKIGDIVLVKQVNAKDLKLYDNIAFYQYLEEDYDTESMPSYNGSSNGGNYDTNISDFMGNGSSLPDEKVDKYSKVIFHQIVDIRIQDNSQDLQNYGKLFFQTQGTANGSPDGHWVMEDYVVGVMVGHNNFLAGLFNFCTSTTGVILLTVLPSLILIVIMAFNVVSEYKKYKAQKVVETNNAQSDKQIINTITSEQDVDKMIADRMAQYNQAKSKEEKLKEILSSVETKEKPKTAVQKVEQKPKVEPKVEQKIAPPKAPPKAPETNASKPAPKTPPKAPMAPKPPVPPKAPPKKQ